MDVITAILFSAVLLVEPLIPGASAAGWRAYLRRVGPIHIGMSAARVRDALREPGASGQESAARQDGCSYLSTAALPPGVAVMLDGDRVVRVDVSTTTIKTASGVGVGSTEDSVKNAYPDRIAVTPHKYVKQGHYLTYVSHDAPDRDVGMIFETDGTQVTSFRVGTVTAIALVERCG